jgi:polar amino acid transport system substrate-binding protein
MSIPVPASSSRSQPSRVSVWNSVVFGAVAMAAGVLTGLVSPEPLSPLTSVAHAQPRATPPAPDLDPSATGLGASGSPQATRRVVLRFVTEGDFPPFNFVDGDGALIGFNVDLARAICLEANSACDIKVRPWEEQFKALAAGEADAAISAHRITWRSAAEVEFSERYFHTPGHFAAKRGGAKLELTPEALDGKAIAVARGTAHEAYLKTFFNDAAIKTFDSVESAREAMADGKVDLIFDDAIGLSLWVSGTNSRGCCELQGGPFLEPKYFGDGLAIAMPKGDPALKQTIDQGLMRVRESGRFDEIVQRYFPGRIY